MPTPDKTIRRTMGFVERKPMDDVSKLVSEARELAEGALTWIGKELSTGEDLGLRVLALCDALESVAKDRNSWHDSAAAMARLLDKYTEQKIELESRIATAAEERDALASALEFYRDPISWMIWANYPDHPSKIQEDKGKIARAALEKLNAK